MKARTRAALLVLTGGLSVLLMAQSSIWPASKVVFTDTDNLQQKFDDGDLGGSERCSEAVFLSTDTTTTTALTADTIVLKSQISEIHDERLEWTNSGADTEMCFHRAGATAELIETCWQAGIANSHSGNSQVAYKVFQGSTGAGSEVYKKIQQYVTGRLLTGADSVDLCYENTMADGECRSIHASSIQAPTITTAQMFMTAEEKGPCPLP